MFLVDLLRKLFSRKEKNILQKEDGTIYTPGPKAEEIHSIWDYLKLNENTQAAHIIAVLGFDEWVPMEEIMRRVRELFHVDYQNDRSLYPYMKTLVDVGLVETQSTGGKKKWRKKDTLIKLTGKLPLEEEEEEKIGVAQQARQ